MRDLIIIGGGAAGLSAAMYGLHKQLDVLLISENVTGKSGWHRAVAGPRGPSFDAGQAAVRLFADQLTSKGGHTLHDSVERVDKRGSAFVVKTARHGELDSLTVVIATGVSPVPLEVPGASDLAGYGLGYSVATYATQASGKTVAVVGSTTRALRGVHELSRIAERVYLVADKSSAMFSPLGIAVQYRPNVTVLEGYHVAEIVGEFRVSELVVQREADVRRIAVDGLFVDLGLNPNNAMVQHLGITDLSGFITVTEGGVTRLPGLYAAGDVTNELSEQLLIAIGQGAQAAVSAYDYILARPSARD